MSDLHTDEQQDKIQLEPLVMAIVSLAERLESLEKFVHEDFIGGIKKLYTTNVRNESIDGLKGKYGEKLSSFEPKIKALFGDDYDTFGNLHDHLEELKGSDTEWNEEKEGGAIEALLSKFKGAFGGGEEPTVEGDEVPVEDKVEEKAPEAVIVEEKTVAKPISDKEKLIKEVLRFKNKK